MERPRIVHYVKSRTSRILNPSKTSHHFTSPTSSLTAMGKATVAPLASVESDMIAITKGRSGNDSLRGRIRKPISETDVFDFDVEKTQELSSRFDQTAVFDTIVFDKGDPVLCVSNLEQSTVSEKKNGTDREQTWSSSSILNQSSQRLPVTAPPLQDKRLGVHMTLCDQQKSSSNTVFSHGPCIEKSLSDGTHRLKGLRTGCCLPQGPTLITPPSQSRTPQAGSNYSSFCICNFQNITQQSNDHKENCPSRYVSKDVARQFTRNILGNSENETTPSESKNEDDSKKQMVISRLFPISTPECGCVLNETSENKLHMVPYSLANNVSAITPSVPNEAYFSNSRSSQDTNHLVPDIQTNSFTQVHCPRSSEQCHLIGLKVNSTCVSNSKIMNFNGSSLPAQHSVEQFLVQEEYEDFCPGFASRPGIDLLSNKCMSSNKSSKNAWNLSADNEMLYFPENCEKKTNFNESNDNKPNSVHDGHDSVTDNLSKNNLKIYNGNVQSKTVREVGLQPSRTQENDPRKSSERDANTEKNPTSERDLEISSSRWKRNSWRLATQGYTSLSDLTSSVECLKLNDILENEDCEEPVGKSREHLSQDRVFMTLSQDKVFMTLSQNKVLKNFEEPFKHIDTVGTNEQPKFHVSHSCEDFHHTSKNDVLSSHDVSDRVNQIAKVEKSPVKRDSFRIATGGVYDVFIVDDKGGKSNKSEIKSEAFVNKEEYDWEFPYAFSLLHSKKRPSKGEKSVACNLYRPGSSPPSSDLEKADNEEYCNKIKRRSFMLATSSMSDLSCTFDEVNVGDWSPIFNTTKQRDAFHTPQVERKHNREPSTSSSRLNSSFGSFYSCQSTVSPKPSPDLSLFDRTKRSELCEESNKVQNSRCSEDSKDSEESFSEDSGIYYTASNTSFHTVGDISNITLKATAEKCKVTSKAPSKNQRRQKSPYNHPQINDYQNSKCGLVGHCLEKTQLGSERKKNQFKPPITLFHCYGCGLGDGFPVRNQQTTQRRRTNDKNNFIVPQSKPEKETANESEFRSRCYTAPTICQSEIKRPNIQFRTPSGQRRVSGYSGLPPTKDHFFNSSLSRSPSPDPSYEDDLEDMLDSKRSPPSLGRPKRKLYAGFDSQPLPMDSFLSDSSSVYSVALSWSSGIPSKSGDVESSYQAPTMSSYPTPAGRSVSSIVSGVSTATRPIAGDNSLDFFWYNKKKRGEVRHDYSFKDRKAFSDESLSSMHSTATATNDNDNLSDVDNPLVSQILLCDSKCEVYRPQTYFYSNPSDSRARGANAKDCNIQQRPLLKSK